jgi:hypothetical protein
MISAGRRRSRAISTASRPASSAIDGSARRDQQRQGLEPLEARRIEERRLAMRSEIEPRLGLEQRAAHRGVVAPHRGPQRMTGVGAAAQQEAHQGQVLAARHGIRATAYQSGVARNSPSSSAIGTAASSSAPPSSSAVTGRIPLASPRAPPPGVTAHAMCSARRPFGSLASTSSGAFARRAPTAAASQALAAANTADSRAASGGA